MARRPTPDELDLWQRVVADTVPLNMERKAALVRAVQISGDSPPGTASGRTGKKAGKGTGRVETGRKTADKTGNRTASRNGTLLPAPVGSRAPSPPPLSGVPDQTPAIDRRTVLRITRGRQRIDGRIDLHGLRAEEAHRALDNFIERACMRGDRCVLVITGKGGRSGREEVSGAGRKGEQDIGVLRRLAPHWLREGANRQRVLACSPAQPKHGGGGALYVILRRPRPVS